MRVHEQDARKFISKLGLAFFLHLALNFKISVSFEIWEHEVITCGKCLN
jgi:hypothetical protein